MKEYKFDGCVQETVIVNGTVHDKVKFFRVLGEETRIRILSRLLHGKEDLSMKKLILYQYKSKSTMSRHLQILIESGIVKRERKGRTFYYSIKNNRVKEILLLLCKFFAGESIENVGVHKCKCEKSERKCG